MIFANPDFMNISMRIAYLLLTGCLLGPAMSLADIALDKSIVDLESGKQRLDDVVVTNVGKTPTRVTVSPTRIDNPGTPQEKREAPENPRELGMIVTPRSFDLQPGEKRTVRLSLLHVPAAHDDIYRIRFAPEDIVATDENGNPQSVEKLQSKLNVIIAYEVLTIVRPANPVLEYRSDMLPGRLSIQNTGNTCFLLFEGKQCRKENDCVGLPPTRVYAGTTVDIPLKSRLPVQYLLEQANQTRLVDFR